MNTTNFQEELTDWIEKIIANNQISTDIVALNFGLFESVDGVYVIYLVGSKRFDSEDSDWACATDFIPKEQYFYIKAHEISVVDWEQFLNLTIETLQKILSSNITNNIFFAHIKNITTGFDDGDLFEIKFI